jgi:hypothetical protein
VTAPPRVVTRRPAPRACEVCGGKKRLRIAFVCRGLGVNWRTGSWGPCFHCDFGWPIRRVALRGDR